MSLLSEFKSNLPLTQLKLLDWLYKIIEKLDKVYTVDSDLICTLYDVTSNSIVTSIVGTDNFNSIFEAIKNNQKLNIDKTSLTVVSGTYSEVSSDDYKSIVLDVIGVFSTSKLQCVRFEIESIDGSMRLVKTITDM